MIEESAVIFLFHFIFLTFSFSQFSFHLCLFLLFLTAIDLVMCVSVRNTLLVCDRCARVLVWGMP